MASSSSASSSTLSVSVSVSASSSAFTALHPLRAAIARRRLRAPLPLVSSPSFASPFLSGSPTARIFAARQLPLPLSPSADPNISPMPLTSLISSSSSSSLSLYSSSSSISSSSSSLSLYSSASSVRAAEQSAYSAELAVSDDDDDNDEEESSYEDRPTRIAVKLSAVPPAYSDYSSQSSTPMLSTTPTATVYTQDLASSPGSFSPSSSAAAPASSVASSYPCCVSCGGALCGLSDWECGYCERRFGNCQLSVRCPGCNRCDICQECYQDTARGGCQDCCGVFILSNKVRAGFQEDYGARLPLLSSASRGHLQNGIIRVHICHADLAKCAHCQHSMQPCDWVAAQDETGRCLQCYESEPRDGDIRFVSRRLMSPKASPKGAHASVSALSASINQLKVSPSSASVASSSSSSSLRSNRPLSTSSSASSSDLGSEGFFEVWAFTGHKNQWRNARTNYAFTRWGRRVRLFRLMRKMMLSASLTASLAHVQAPVTVPISRE